MESKGKEKEKDATVSERAEVELEDVDEHSAALAVAIGVIDSAVIQLEDAERARDLEVAAGSGLDESNAKLLKLMMLAEADTDAHAAAE